MVDRFLEEPAKERRWILGKDANALVILHERGERRVKLCRNGSGVTLSREDLDALVAWCRTPGQEVLDGARVEPALAPEGEIE